ncbi:unnamed protein product [Brassica oleracea var. botrytis]|uniref:(rape) hypothetical protein n=1 Tax=Brassica napus TaxID=3708 RepID=A0A816J5I6_BRANA|nr:unnamed protein product [Brassica napus]
MFLVTVKFMLCAKIKLVANLQIIALDKDIYWTEETPLDATCWSDKQFGRRKRWGEKISFKAWAKFSCALVVSVKQISGPLLLYDDRVYRWVSSSRTNQIVGGSPSRPNIESTVALLLDDDESNRRWLFSSTRNQIIGGFCQGGSIRMLLLLKSKDLKRNRDGVIEEHDLQVKRLEDKITQLIRLVLLLPQALPLAMDQERRGRFVINKDEKSNTGNTFVFG